MRAGPVQGKAQQRDAEEQDRDLPGLPQQQGPELVQRVFHGHLLGRSSARLLVDQSLEALDLITRQFGVLGQMQHQ